jgi:hypothetical protein
MNSSAPTSISDSGRETQKSKPMNRTMKFAWQQMWCPPVRGKEKHWVVILGVVVVKHVKMYCLISQCGIPVHYHVPVQLPAKVCNSKEDIHTYRRMCMYAHALTSWCTETMHRPMHHALLSRQKALRLLLLPKNLDSLISWQAVYIM